MRGRSDLMGLMQFNGVFSLTRAKRRSEEGIERQRRQTAKIEEAAHQQTMAALTVPGNALHANLLAQHAANTAQ